MTSRPDRTDVVLVRPATGGPSSVGAACTRELRARGVEVQEILLPERGWRALHALGVVIRARTRIRGARAVHVEVGITAVSSFWFLVWAGLVRRDMIAVAHDAPAFVRHPAAGIVPERAGLVDAFVHRLLVPLLDAPLSRWAKSRVGRWAVLSPKAAAEAAANGMRPVVILRHGADAPVPGPSPAEAAYVLLAGYLGPGKGLDTLRQAWQLVGDQMALPLRIAGTAGRAHQAWLDCERDRFDRLPNPPTWLGWLDDDEFQSTIAGAAIVVIPYEKSNPASGILTRSKVQGRAIVATRVPAAEGEIEDGRDGVLVEPSDAGQLAAALLDLARDPDRRTALGAQAAERAEAEHSWPRYVDELYRDHDLTGPRT